MHRTTDQTPRTGTPAAALVALDELPIVWQALAFDLLFAGTTPAPADHQATAAAAVGIPDLARTA